VENSDPYWKFTKMNKSAPIRFQTADITSVDAPEEDDPLDPVLRVAVGRRVYDRNIDQLFSVVMGLPGRVRQYMRRVNKLRAQGLCGDQLAEDLAPLAQKILTDRLEVAVLVPARIVYDEKGGAKNRLSKDQLTKMSSAALECDALLTLLAPHFLPGVTCRLAITAKAVTTNPVLRGHMSGLADVLDYGAYTKSQRASRRHDVRVLMKQEGWELPEVGA
jgi:hypothetical protein